MDACHKKEREITGPNLVEALVDSYEVMVLDGFHTGSMYNLEAVREA